MIKSLFKKKKKTLLDTLSEKNKKDLGSSLKKSSGFFSSIFGDFWRRKKVDQEFVQSLEENLISLDFGYSLSEYLSKSISSSFSKSGDLLDSIKGELLSVYKWEEPSLNIQKGRRNIVLVVGSNGVGKTTSIAKLANYFKNEDFKVLLVAGDTFRAGAVEQLNIWAEKLNIDIVNPSRAMEDPSALIYRALSEYTDYDLVICDTSGRQHNNKNLLQELNKVHRTIKKFDPSSPHESLLVLDSTIGQSSLLQAQQFLDNSEISGIVLTKMDSLTRGGIIFSIREKFGIPVKFLGTGESIDDLYIFDLEEVISSWFDHLRPSD
ncbi:signal recognition particle receptor protein FtsY (alpha subunit) [Mycoplasma haemofelis str. Langford 1]|uniref:Signal recognition particle receptor FtsY n=1 Tax=Mycoplasma haemofelis (strain Langford 1) TaxID=941640 RepID=E8ZGG9_MYCHL|nr:signal recognition particle-docking protein FtsY [Mycoplasma haemofelis]CBY92039.1 signal recognition particle receptor protein FtsY (alpha subunit) [Mycoplasma haemofelis str. Langford 1]